MKTKIADTILKAIGVGVMLADLYTLSAPAAIVLLPLSIYCLIATSREKTEASL